MLRRVPQRSEIRPQRHDSCGKKHGRASCKMSEPFLPQGGDAFTDPEEGRRKEEIVGNLRMVGADFERGEERRQGRAPPRMLRAERHPDSAHHQRRIDQCPHLGDVSGADDEDKVGGQAVSQRRDDPHPRVDARHQQHDPHGAHGEEEECGRRIDDPHHLPDGILYQLGGITDIDQVGGHAAEHRSEPLRIFAVLLARLIDLTACAFVLLYIVLRQHVAAELGCEIACRHRKEEQQGD